MYFYEPGIGVNRSGTSPHRTAQHDIMMEMKKGKSAGKGHTV